MLAFVFGCYTYFVEANLWSETWCGPVTLAATLEQVTCFPVSGPIFAGKFQFSGTADSGRWTGKDDEAIEVHGGTDSLHFAAG